MNNTLNAYQDVIVKIYKAEDEPGIRYLSHKVNPGARHMAHLKEAAALALTADSNRVIIIADSKAYAYQAASYLLAKSQGTFTSKQNSTSEYDEDEYDFEAFFDELPDMNDYDERIFDLSKDMLAVSAGMWCTETDELPGNMLLLQKQASINSMIYKASHMLLYCDRRDQDCDRLMEEIENHIEHLKNFFLLLPSASVSESFVERLAFEHGFTVIHVNEPSTEQLIELFSDLADKCGLSISEDVDIRDIIHELKNYRKDLFWERDIEKLIRDTKNNVKERAAGRKDFSLYYYKGQGLSGEMLLSKIIGQKEVKEQILKMVSSFKLAALLKDKYRTEAANYKHMAFAGAPGTGKTRIARIVAKIFHEQGLSNGVFIEAGRNDLVAGYLGQTAMKISKLFEKAKGGVIFIDEAGSLVQNEQDIYTKEAITTLIRFMENNPDTTVIFASYPDEIDALLDSDRGFRSRIAKIIEFESYTDEELWEILRYMAADQHYTIDDNAKELVFKYIEALKNSAKEEFGNAREMRKLFQTAQEEAASRILSNKANSRFELISCEDIKKAICNLTKTITKVTRPIGFSITANHTGATAI